MEPLVVIPARAGSKGVPGKNIKLLDGKPLIKYTIDAALEVFNSNQIIVSTDSPDIKRVAEQSGLVVPFLRPDHLATDTASSHDVIVHAMNYCISNYAYTPNTIVLLQPTSPFRKGNHIKAALDLYDPSLDMVVSVKETDANPYYVLYEEDEEKFLRKANSSNAKRRQDVPKVWELNGAIYIIKPESIKTKEIGEFDKVIKYEMDSMSSIDIDTPLDWEIAEIISKKIE